MSQHTEQIASVIRREVQGIILRGLHDPRIRGMISIISVEVEPDLSRARLSVSIHPEKFESLTLKGLQAAGKHIRRTVASRIRIRRMPRLEFCSDPSIKKQAAFERALNQGSGEESPDTQALSPALALSPLPSSTRKELKEEPIA